MYGARKEQMTLHEAAFGADKSQCSSMQRAAGSSVSPGLLLVDINLGNSLMIKVL